MSNYSDIVYRGQANYSYGFRPNGVAPNNSIVAIYYGFGQGRATYGFNVHILLNATVRGAGGAFVLEGPSEILWRIPPFSSDPNSRENFDRLYSGDLVMSSNEHIPRTDNGSFPEGWKLHFTPDRGNDRVFISYVRP